MNEHPEVLQGLPDNLMVVEVDPAEPKHHVMVNEVPAASPPEPTLAPAPPTERQIAMMRWLIQLEQRRMNPIWLGRVRSAEHYTGEKVTVIHRGSRLESSRRKARRTLGTLSGRQWVKARKTIRRIVKARERAEAARG